MAHREVGREVHLDNVVDPCTIGDLHYPSCGVFRAVVDYVVGAGLNGDPSLVVRAHRADNRRSPQLGFLNSVVPDCAGAPRHQHGLAGYRSVGEQAAVCRHGRNAEAGALFEGDRWRQRNGVVGWLGGVFGGGAEGPAELRFEQPDSLTQSGFRHTRS